MNIVTGGTGQVGAALAEALLKKGEPVTIISRTSKNARQWVAKGAQIVVADIYDTLALHEIFKKARAIFLLNPPADPMTDTTVQELKTVSSLLQALKYSGAEKVVVESTLGAQKGSGIGDLGVLFELEHGVSKLSYPYSIIRPAYYMSNWKPAIKTIDEKGEIVSFYPADFKMPMVAPKDIGEFAADLMTQKDSPALSGIQGPCTYSANDVATAFSKHLHKEVRVKVVPKEEWETTYQSMGFSAPAAKSYARMTAISLESDYEMPDNMIRGRTTLEDYIAGLAGARNTTAQ